MAEGALITGASQGIGYEIAKALAKKGKSLLLVARNKQRLEEVAHEFSRQTPCEILAEDLSDPAAPEKIESECRRLSFQVDELVNNAGFGVYGPFLITPIDDELRSIQVNVRALVHLSKLFLPAMVSRRTGGILNVASTAAFQPGPLMAIYYSTKAFVLSFSEALSEEVRGTNVRISALCPGPTRTGFQAAAHMEKSKLFESSAMEARDVAEIGIRDWRRGKRIIIPGFRNRVLANSIRFFPRSVVPCIVKKVQETRS